MDLFKETNTACYTALIPVAFFGALAGAHLSLPLARILHLAIVWAFLNAVAFGIIAHVKFEKLSKLHFDCDIENFRAAFEKIAQRRLGATKKRAVHINLSAAYLQSGDNAAASQLLHGPIFKRASKTRRMSAPQEFVYHNNLFALYHNTGDLDAAAQALGQMENVLQNRRMLGAVRKLYQEMLAPQRQMLNMAGGNYDGAEEIFMETFYKSEHRLHKVVAKLALGEIYLHLGKLAQAEQAFEYVVEHGGTSIYRAKATEQLEKLGKTVCLPPEEKPPFAVFSTRERAAMIVYCALVVTASLALLVAAFAGII